MCAPIDVTDDLCSTRATILPEHPIPRSQNTSWEQIVKMDEHRLLHTDYEEECSPESVGARCDFLQDVTSWPWQTRAECRQIYKYTYTQVGGSEEGPVKKRFLSACSCVIVQAKKAA